MPFGNTMRTHCSPSSRVCTRSTDIHTLSRVVTLLRTVRAGAQSRSSAAKVWTKCRVTCPGRRRGRPRTGRPSFPSVGLRPTGTAVTSQSPKGAGTPRCCDAPEPARQGPRLITPPWHRTEPPVKRRREPARSGGSLLCQCAVLRTGSAPETLVTFLQPRSSFLCTSSGFPLFGFLPSAICGGRSRQVSRPDTRSAALPALMSGW